MWIFFGAWFLQAVGLILDAWMLSEFLFTGLLFLVHLL